MLAQADLLFMNIDLLHIIDQFLFHPVIIDIFLAHMFFQQLVYFLPDPFLALGSSFRMVFPVR